MKKVITYGTYDLMHYGHIRLLERAKALGDYLIVGVTSDDFDKTRGKINVQQSLMERIENVRKTGLADKIIVEEYEGQKIDDIIRYSADIFTVGSDWVGKFDYLNKYCDVIYLERTEGISSTQIRSEKRSLRLGLVGEVKFIEKYYNESKYANGLDVVGVYTLNSDLLTEHKEDLSFFDSYDKCLQSVDAVYIASHPSQHYKQVREALTHGKHVLCESPIAMSEKECEELFNLAKEKNLVLMDSIKTAYSNAYNRLLLLLQGRVIGDIISIDATCTSLVDSDVINQNRDKLWNSICSWGPTAMLPILQILGTSYTKLDISSLTLTGSNNFDLFTRINFTYSNAVASLKVGNGVKSEGSLIITGTEGYIYVPAPWWKTDYFEVKYENPEKNKRYFYQLSGEGLRSELVSFVKSIIRGNPLQNINTKVSTNICKIIEEFNNNNYATLVTNNINN